MREVIFYVFLLHCRRTASKVDIKGFSLSDVVSLKFLISLSSVFSRSCVPWKALASLLLVGAMQCIGSSFWQAAPVPTVTANLALSSFCLTANNRQTFCLTNNIWIKTWGRTADKYIIKYCSNGNGIKSVQKESQIEENCHTLQNKISGLSKCKYSPEGQCAKLSSWTTICERVVRNNNFQKLQK